MDNDLPPDTNDSNSGPKVIEKIYFAAIAKQLARNSREVLKESNYRKPMDTESYNLAAKFVTQYLSQKKFKLSLNTAVLESKNLFKIKEQKPYVNKVLKVDTEKSAVIQLTAAKKAKKPKKESRKKIQQNLMQSDDSELTEQSIVAEAIELRQRNLEENQKSVKSRKIHKKNKANINTGDTFTEESEIFVLPVHDPAYALPKDIQAKIVKSRNPPSDKSSKSKSTKRSLSKHQKSSKKTSTNIDYSAYSYTYTYDESAPGSSKQTAAVMKLPTPPISEGTGSYASGSYYTGYSYSYTGTYGTYYDPSSARQDQSYANRAVSFISSSNKSEKPPKQEHFFQTEPERAPEGSPDYLVKIRGKEIVSSDDEGNSTGLDKYSAPAIAGIKPAKNNEFFNKEAVAEAQKERVLKPSELKKLNFSERSAASKKSGTPSEKGSGAAKQQQKAAAKPAQEKPSSRKPSKVEAIEEVHEEEEEDHEEDDHEEEELEKVADELEKGAEEEEEEEKAEEEEEEEEVAEEDAGEQ